MGGYRSYCWHSCDSRRWLSVIIVVEQSEDRRVQYMFTKLYDSVHEYCGNNKTTTSASQKFDILAT